MVEPLPPTPISWERDGFAYADDYDQAADRYVDDVLLASPRVCLYRPSSIANRCP